MDKIKVGAVNYLNTKPLLYGIQDLLLKDDIELVTGYPAHIAQQLLSGAIDIGLVPVAIIPELKNSFIETDFCIGATGPVASVCLFSEVPIEKIETVWLDYQSRTSVNLARILLKNFWKKKVKFLPAKEGYQYQIKGTTAGVVIGDRAFAQRLVSPYMYDLAEAWLTYSGLPFVFAAWIANKKLSADFLQAFNAANAIGLNNLPAVLQENSYDKYNLHTYYTENISYNLDEQKRMGLQNFLKELKVLNSNKVIDQSIF
ncbi:MAG: menaquinone biosynthesis protein [Bacteroidota bacterium]